MQDQDAVVIDTNALVAQKLEALSGSAQIYRPQGAQDAEDAADDLSAILEDRGGEPGGFTEGLAGVARKMEVVPEESGPSPEELLAEAREQIGQMQQEAAQQIERERAAALAQAKQEGYDAGYSEGMRQTERLKEELAGERRRMAAEYEQKIAELEPLFIETLSGIYEHVFKVNMETNKQLLLYLAENTIRNIEGSREFLVHVSKEDYAAVNMQKKQLEAAAAGANTSVEIVQDATLSEGECMVETDGGIFDCGLGTQLAELTKQLKLLAYSGE